ncbi:MAG TPA: acetoin dehydrogenase dihydrolipoyllysine-residue acetyltransferase subunit [Roseiarcus sp.]|nr:acetoin dehydrogenase dihydrolipoyllysine-residue acetyltransferase subunit [Roseiarcus sp.]
MAVEIVMPRVDMDMASGRMGRWHAAEGAHVVRGATLFEIETDKAAMEVDAPASGVLKFIAASEGDVLPVGACIGWIVVEGENFVPPMSDAPAPVAAASGADPKTNDAAYAEGALGLRATPAARRIARNRGVRLSGVKGSGPNGRIQKRDVEGRAASVDAVTSVDADASVDAVHSPSLDGRPFGRPMDRIGRAPQGVRKDARLSTGDGARRNAVVDREWLQRGEGAPIVFLHGFGADLNGWRPVHRLLPETRPALAIDLPGHGLSPLGEDASFEALVEAARRALIGEGVGAAHLVGHSLGGAVAVALSRGASVKALSLMLIAPAGLGEETDTAFFEGFLQADTEAALTPWLHMLVTDPAALGSALARTTLRQRRERPLVAEQRRLAKAILRGGRQAIDVRDLLAAPQAPTKIVVGIEDRITPAHHADGLSGLIALHRFAHVGHMPHLEARREVARLIEELVRSGEE